MLICVAFVGPLAAEDFFAAQTFRANGAGNHRQPYLRDCI